MPDDPLAPVLTGLAYVATANPASVATPPQPANTWDPPKTATPTGTLSAVVGLMQLLYTASDDMKTVGSDIFKALDEVTKVVKQLSDALDDINTSDIDDVMNGLQQALSMAQTLLPGDHSPVLDSGSKLFQQIHDLIASVGVDKAKAELALLGQVLAMLSLQFKPT